MRVNRQAISHFPGFLGDRDRDDAPARRKEKKPSGKPKETPVRFAVKYSQHFPFRHPYTLHVLAKKLKDLIQQKERQEATLALETPRSRWPFIVDGASIPQLFTISAIFERAGLTPKKLARHFDLVANNPNAECFEEGVIFQTSKKTSTGHNHAIRRFKSTYFSPTIKRLRTHRFGKKPDLPPAKRADNVTIWQPKPAFFDIWQTRLPNDAYEDWAQRSKTPFTTPAVVISCDWIHHAICHRKKTQPGQDWEDTMPFNLGESIGAACPVPGSIVMLGAFESNWGSGIALKQANYTLVETAKIPPLKQTAAGKHAQLMTIEQRQRHYGGTGWVIMDEDNQSYNQGMPLLFERNQ